MIAKILSSNNSFEAVKYNNKNIKKKGGELLAVRNMEFDKNTAKMNAIKTYLKTKSEILKLNKSRFKNLQFHATISCKGREKSKEELKDIGDKWMAKMGYGKQPYISIFHRDTNNNHIHLVSTRVDLQTGKKIKDSKEGENAGKFINEICNIEAKQKNKIDDQILNRYLEDYKYDSFTSMKSFLNSQNFQVYMDFDNMDIHINKNQNENIINRDKLQIINSIEDKEKKRIQALIFKSLKTSDKNLYAKINRADKKMYDIKSELIENLRKQFGIEIKPIIQNGEVKNYTLVDHKTKSVYNGNSIIRANNILDSPINIIGTEELKEIDKFHANTPEKRKLLSSYYFIPESEINLKYGKSNSLEKMKEQYQSSKTLDHFLQETDSKLITGDKGEKFILNQNEHIIEKASDVFGVEKDIKIEKAENIEPELNNQNATGIINALSQNTTAPSDDERDKKRKGRKKKRGRR